MIIGWQVHKLDHMALAIYYLKVSQPKISPTPSKDGHFKRQKIKECSET